MKVLEAENHILEENYNSAFDTYKSVFIEYETSFYKDIHNACICALITGYNQDALLYAKKLILQGYELDDFQKDAFKKLTENKIIWEELENEYPALRYAYLKSIDSNLRSKYMEIYQLDQIASDHTKGLNYQDSIFRLLTLKTTTLIKENGFPKWMTNKDTINIKINTILRHYYGFINRLNNENKLQYERADCKDIYNEFRLLIDSALHNGSLSPDDYETIVTYWEIKPQLGKVALCIDYDLEKVYPIFSNTSVTESETINARRKSVGLHPIESGGQDIIYNSWYKNFPFKEIKEAIYNCTDCHTKVDYLKIRLDTSGHYEKKYQENKLAQDTDWFIIKFSLDNFKEIHNRGQIFQDIADGINNKTRN
jgi:hypothetical protein